jgi:hypothetical protein
MKVDGKYFIHTHISWRIPSSGMLRHVALVRTDVSEESRVSIIRVTRIGKLGTTLAVTSNRRTLWRNTMSHSISLFTDSCNPDDRGATFLQNVGSYKSHTVKHPRKRSSSLSPPWKLQILHVQVVYIFILTYWAIRLNCVGTV